MVESQRVFFAQCVNGDFGVLVKMDSQNFTEIMLFLGLKGEKQLGTIFSYFVVLAI
jgi:hypothetical protein